jgi:hypothetical protein
MTDLPSSRRLVDIPSVSQDDRPSPIGSSGSWLGSWLLVDRVGDNLVARTDLGRQMPRARRPYGHRSRERQR